MDDIIMKMYGEALEEFDETVTKDEGYMSDCARFGELNDKLWAYICDGVRKEFLEYDSLNGYILAYSQMYFFKQGWKKCMEYMNNK